MKDWSDINIDVVEIEEQKAYIYFKDEYVSTPEKLVLDKSDLVKLCKALGVTSDELETKEKSNS